MNGATNIHLFQNCAAERTVSFQESLNSSMTELPSRLIYKNFTESVLLAFFEVAFAGYSLSEA